MEILYRWIDGINDVLWSYLLVALLLGCAVWFTLRTRGVQFRMLGEMVRVLGESAGSGPRGEKHVSSFQAFAVLSMAPSNPMINEVQEAQELLSESSDIGLAQNVIRDRKVYRDAMLSGRGVVEMTNSTAKAEIQLLADEIFQ